MKAAFCSRIITPPIGVPLAGNGREDSRSRGIHDDLRANYAYLESGMGRHLFVGLDLLGLLQRDIDRVKERIGRETGLGQEQITVFCTHTHSGPNTMGIFPVFLTQEDLDACEGYVEWLVGELSRDIPRLIDSAEESMMAYGRDVVEGCSFNRRVLLKDGALKMVFEDYALEEMDRLAGPNGYPVMSVYLFTDRDEAVRGILVGYTSHPAVVCGHQWLYSRDYIDSLTVELQKRYGKEVVVLYMNGAQGNLVAADPYKPFVTGFEEAERVGKKLADGAKRMVSRLLMERQFQQDVAIRSRMAQVTLPIRAISPEEVARAGEMLRTADHSVLLHGLDPKVEAGSILEMAAYPLKEETTVLQAVCIGDTLLVAFPGEVFFEIGWEVIRHSPWKHTAIIGLANGMVGYIPTKQAFKEGGYEIKTSLTSSRFAPEASELLARAAMELTQQMGKERAAQ